MITAGAHRMTLREAIHAPDTGWINDIDAYLDCPGFGATNLWAAGLRDRARRICLRVSDRHDGRVDAAEYKRAKREHNSAARSDQSVRACAHLSARRGQGCRPL